MSWKLFRDFVLRCNNYEERTLVELKKVSEDAELLSPTSSRTLPLTDLEESIRKLPDMIIYNFLRNYGTNKFPLKGLKTLVEIINCQDVDGRIRQILLLHLTKAHLSIGECMYYFASIKTLVCQPSPEQQLWLKFALDTIKHPQIIRSIDDLISKHFDCATFIALQGTSVKFVSMDTNSLRGYSGFNDVFINENHFINKYSKIMLQPNINKMIQMDIISITLHEFAHVRLRQKLNDFNKSTAARIENSQNHQSEDMEFGRMAEIQIFEGQVDWLKSVEAVDMTFVDNFMDAIEKGRDIPNIQPNTLLTYRKNPSVRSGVDIEIEDFLC